MKKSSTSKRLKKIMNSRGLRQIDILNMIKDKGFYMSKGALSQYINGKSEPDQEKLSILSEVLNVSETYLMGYGNPGFNDADLERFNNVVRLNEADLKEIPILGQIACGSPNFYESSYDEYINIDSNVFDADFALKADGWSMVNAGIDDGDIVFFKYKQQVENGSIIAVSIDDKATLKRFLRVNNSEVILQPYNDQMSPIILRESDNLDIRIIGEKVAVLKISNT